MQTLRMMLNRLRAESSSSSMLTRVLVVTMLLPACCCSLSRRTASSTASAFLRACTQKIKQEAQTVGISRKGRKMQGTGFPEEGCQDGDL